MAVPQRQVEISTVIKALQRDADVREDWLAHCKASDASKDVPSFHPGSHVETG